MLCCAAHVPSCWDACPPSFQERRQLKWLRAEALSSRCPSHKAVSLAKVPCPSQRWPVSAYRLEYINRTRRARSGKASVRHEHCGGRDTHPVKVQGPATSVTSEGSHGVGLARTSPLKNRLLCLTPPTIMKEARCAAGRFGFWRPRVPHEGRLLQCVCQVTQKVAALRGP